MPKFKPLYRYSINDARENSQLPQWRESQAENLRCCNFIDEQIKQNWDGMHLTGDIQKKAVEEFGHDRTMWVLANHIQHNKDDMRFSSDNREWAKGIYIPLPEKEQLRRDPHLSDHTAAYLLHSHPDKINELTELVRRQYDDIGMLDYHHRVPDSSYADYTGKILILRADVLSEEYKSPENQLFRADSGFGCDPSASGRAVYGQFLIDGEKARFDRGDFVGVLDDRHLPDCAKEKLQQAQTAADAPEEGSQPVMKGM